MDYSNLDNIINGFNKILKLNSSNSVPPVPIPLILLGVPKRSGLSPTKIANRIIARKSEAGLITGALPSGSKAPDEIMEIIRIEEIIRAFQEEAIVSVGIGSGIALTATGANAGGPIQVVGSTVKPFRGYGVII